MWGTEKTSQECRGRSPLPGFGVSPNNFFLFIWPPQAASQKVIPPGGSPSTSIARHHAEWLSCIEISGPFLSMPVLLDIFPQGLDAHDPTLSRVLRMAYDEWADNQSGARPDRAIHTQWLRFVLSNVLEMPREVLAEGPALPAGLSAHITDENETLRPDIAILTPDERKPRLLIKLYPAGQDLEKAVAGQRWHASPATRMMELLRAYWRAPGTCNQRRTLDAGGRAAQ